MQCAHEVTLCEHPLLLGAHQCTECNAANAMQRMNIHRQRARRHSPTAGATITTGTTYVTPPSYNHSAPRQSASDVCMHGRPASSDHTGPNKRERHALEWSIPFPCPETPRAQVVPSAGLTSIPGRMQTKKEKKRKVFKDKHRQQFLVFK